MTPVAEVDEGDDGRHRRCDDDGHNGGWETAGRGRRRGTAASHDDGAAGLRGLADGGGGVSGGRVGLTLERDRPIKLSEDPQERRAALLRVNDVLDWTVIHADLAARPRGRVIA